MNEVSYNSGYRDGFEDAYSKGCKDTEKKLIREIYGYLCQFSEASYIAETFAEDYMEEG